jgi:hypothetical protein
MYVLHPRCAGLDVHKDSVVAAIRLAPVGPPRTEAHTFDTTTPGLLSLSSWLTECDCTHLAMEATGIYWKPEPSSAIWRARRFARALAEAGRSHPSRRDVRPPRSSGIGAGPWQALPGWYRSPIHRLPEDSLRSSDRSRCPHRAAGLQGLGTAAGVGHGNACARTADPSSHKAVRCARIGRGWWSCTHIAANRNSPLSAWHFWRPAIPGVDLRWQ